MYSDRGSPEVRRLAAELYADKRRYLLNIARRNAVNEADAEAALQETFANFLRAFSLTLVRRPWRG